MRRFGGRPSRPIAVADGGDRCALALAEVPHDRVWISGRLRGIGPLTRWLRAARTLAAQLVHMTDTHDLRSAECLDSYSRISDPVTEPPCGGGVVTCSVCRDLSPLG